jgi:type III pantothenate kinase
MEMEALDLVLDVGNTRTKAAFFGDKGIVDRAHLPQGDLEALDEWIAGRPMRSAVIGSVAARDRALVDHLRRSCPVFEIGGDTPTPLRNAYTTPLSLGVDRLANAVAAALRFPDRPVLAIDAGTCITYDVVDADGSYVGGAISPGMLMRAKAMHAYSARLPLSVPLEQVPVFGTDTSSSLSVGIHHGIVGEIRGFIEHFGYHRPHLAVVLTGGDALRFVRALKSGIFAHPLLTLEGLHAIHVFNRAGDARPGGPGTPDSKGTGPAGQR